MKTILHTLIIILLLIGLSQNANAQKAIGIFNKRTVKEMYKADSMNMTFSEAHKNDVNIKAVRNFIKFYKDISDVQWYTVEDGFIAKFQKDGIETKVEYDVTGKRRNILRTYDESHMAFEIRDLVKRQYYDYNILVTYEIEHSNGVIYMVKIMDKATIKLLQIVNNEMKVVEDFVNGNG